MNKLFFTLSLTAIISVAQPPTQELSDEQPFTQEDNSAVEKLLLFKQPAFCVFGCYIKSKHRHKHLATEHQYCLFCHEQFQDRPATLSHYQETHKNTNELIKNLQRKQRAHSNPKPCIQSTSNNLANNALNITNR